MSLTYTPTGNSGSLLPKFTLPSVEGKVYSADDFTAPAVLVMFICNHCPYVKAIEGRLLTLAREFRGRGLDTLAICANDPSEYPEDAPEELLKTWRDKNYGFPYLLDTDQKVAKAFGAVCTPDLFLYDAQRQLAYRGRLDDAWKNEARVQRQELREAVVALLAGRAVNSAQNPSMGCSIKWK